MAQTKHGTITAYTHHCCRCDDCRAANRRREQASRVRRYAARRVVGGRLVAVDATEHGKGATYNYWGCRCLPCTVAHRERRRMQGAS